MGKGLDSVVRHFERHGKLINSTALAYLGKSRGTVSFFLFSQAKRVLDFPASGPVILGFAIGSGLVGPTVGRSVCHGAILLSESVCLQGWIIRREL